MTSSTTGKIHQLNVSRGGVPKRPIERAEVTKNGMAGDRQAKPGIHGGPYRALCMFPLEQIEALAAEGHPITPGSIGENVTTEGLDWSALVPGMRLRLGPQVRVEITSYATPCTTISGSFSDGNMNRVLQQRAPGRSRIYLQVLEEGVLRPGDPIEVEARSERSIEPIRSADAVQAFGQVALPVSNLEQSIAFYRDRLGASFVSVIDPPGLAMFDLAGTRLMLDGPSHSPGARAGSSTLYFRVADIDASYRAMRERGVEFADPPLMVYEQNGVEGWMAFFSDLDGNKLALSCEVQRR